jgi:hypothetical protein
VAGEGRKRTPGGIASAHAELGPDDVGVAAELALPEVVADDDDGRGREARFGLGECPAQHRLESGYPEVVLADEHALERLAPFVEDHEVERPAVSGECLERFGVALPLVPLWRRPAPGVDLPSFGGGRLDQDEGFRIAIRGRREEHALDQTEDRRRRADPEREREHGNGRESRLLPQFPPAKTHVIQHWSILGSI